MIAWTEEKKSYACNQNDGIKKVVLMCWHEKVLQLSACIYDARIMLRFNTSNHKCGRMCCNIEMLALFFHALSSLNLVCLALRANSGLFALFVLAVCVFFTLLFQCPLYPPAKLHDRRPCFCFIHFKLKALRMFDFGCFVFISFGAKVNGHICNVLIGSHRGSIKTESRIWNEFRFEFAHFGYPWSVELCIGLNQWYL